MPSGPSRGELRPGRLHGHSIREPPAGEELRMLRLQPRRQDMWRQEARALRRALAGPDGTSVEQGYARGLEEGGGNVAAPSVLQEGAGLRRTWNCPPVCGKVRLAGI